MQTVHALHLTIIKVALKISHSEHYKIKLMVIVSQEKLSPPQGMYSVMCSLNRVDRV